MAEPTEKEISVPWPTKTAITVQLTTPPKGVKLSGFALVLGPGAGGDENQALLVEVARAAAKEGHFCARYRAKVPNLGFRVNVCTRVIEHLFHPTTGQHPMTGCFLGGHSMGTRVAGTVSEQLANTESSESSSSPAEKIKGKKTGPSKSKKGPVASSSSGYPPHFIRGLTLFSYPLHTPDNTKALRDQILLNIPSTVATLMVSGLKDTMCQPALFSKVFKDMKSSPREVVQIDGADHGLGYGSAKSHAGKKEALISAVADWTIQFMDDAIAKKESAKTEKAIAIKKMAEVKKVADEWTVATTTA
ncbi:hypothetical protein BGZ59_011146 [Podila verticillata]|nr:hypothetical protein BGZ59_011146 [Podila verticillata]KFH71422.1 hypothetical protein MVEG_01721 [Podila verticillata NRRL 6337]